MDNSRTHLLVRNFVCYFKTRKKAKSKLGNPLHRHGASLSRVRAKSLKAWPMYCCSCPNMVLLKYQMAKRPHMREPGVL